MSTEASTSDAPRTFPHTRWSAVLAARLQPSSQSAAALEDLCRAYWRPLYAYVRRCGHPPHDAQDLTQEFFQRLLEKRWLDAADPAKGRLRTFLIVALKNFMSKEWRRAHAQRRGGGRSPVPFDTELAESHFAADLQSIAPDDAFDRQWALTLLELSVQRLRAEFESTGRIDQFEALKDCLVVPRGGIDYATVARRCGMNEGASRVAAHRLRKRFREIYREELKQTLADGGDLDAELRHLAAVLARG